MYEGSTMMDIHGISRDEKGRIVEGSAPLNPGGMQRGVKQEATQIRLAFFEAFRKTGGLEEMIAWINSCSRNRREFYKMLLQIIPKEMVLEEERQGSRVIIVRSPEAKTGAVGQ